MALTNEQITAKNFKDFYTQIRPYLNGAAHSGFTPVGTVISVMGNSAPMNYLACNGQVVNIADYPELATYFNTQFGSSNYFGGNGTTTFGIPDLRGEFLRGTGTNSHANQGDGANVGAHQNGTEVPRLGTNASKGAPISYGKEAYVVYPDKNLGAVSSKAYYVTNNCMGEDAVTDVYPKYTSRPTNTSVLYCIATKNIFMDAGSNYSTEEQVVGTWINGKPIYQRTIDCGTLPDNSSKTVSTEIPNIYDVVDFDGVAIEHSGASGYISSNLPLPHISTSGNSVSIWTASRTNSLDVNLVTTGTRSSYTAYVTVRYTKTTD